MCGRGWLILVLILKAYLAVLPIGEYAPKVSDAVDKSALGKGHTSAVGWDCWIKVAQFGTEMQIAVGSLLLTLKRIPLSTKEALQSIENVP